MSSIVANPYQYFTDRNGGGLNEGFLYIGQENQDPELFPIDLFWDEALTIPADQPLRTIAGYIVNPGAGNSPADAYMAEEAYSIRVRTSGGVQAYYRTNALALDRNLRSDLAEPTGPSHIGRYATVDALLASTAPAAGAGKTWQAAQYTYTEAAPDAADYHVITAGGVKLYVMPSEGGIWAEAFGINATNNAATNAALFTTLWNFAAGRLTRMGNARVKADISYSGAVNFQGDRMPTANTGRTALENGSIIEGTLNLSGTSVVLRDLGVDHGSGAFGSGSDAIKLSPATYNAGRLALLENVIGMGRDAADAFHAILVEGYEFAFLNNVVGVRNQYCAAIKSRNVTINGFRGIGGQNGIIFKSDGASAGSGSLSYVNATGINIEGSADTVYGIRILAQNASIAAVNISNVNMVSVDYGLIIEAAAGTAISEVNISNLNATTVRQFGISTGGAGGLYEVTLSSFNMVGLGSRAAQFQIGRKITVRDFYGSMAAGATTQAADWFRVEAGVGGFTGDNLEFVENYGAGSTVPSLYLQCPRPFIQLKNIKANIEGSLPLYGFPNVAPAVSGSSVTLNPTIDLDTKSSFMKVSAAAGVEIVNINSVIAGTTRLPEGYRVTIMPISAVNFVFKQNSVLLNTTGADVTKTVNQTITYTHTGGGLWVQQ